MIMFKKEVSKLRLRRILLYFPFVLWILAVGMKAINIIEKDEMLCAILVMGMGLMFCSVMMRYYIPSEEKQEQELALIIFTNLLYFFTLLVLILTAWNTKDEYLWMIGMMLAFFNPLLACLIFYSNLRKKLGKNS